MPATLSANDRRSSAWAALVAAGLGEMQNRAEQGDLDPEDVVLLDTVDTSDLIVGVERGDDVDADERELMASAVHEIDTHLSSCRAWFADGRCALLQHATDGVTADDLASLLRHVGF
jgi:hypothetical protein